MKLEDIFASFPEVTKPLKKLSLKEKLIWTGLALVLYFLLSLTPLYGLSSNYVAQFETLAILMAASFGSIISLGIGPLVTGSIMLQLLTGAEMHWRCGINQMVLIRTSCPTATWQAPAGGAHSL